MNRLAMYGGVAALAVMLVFAAGCQKGADQKQATDPVKVEEAAPAAEKKAATTGVPGLANVPFKGAKDPKVVIIESSDFQ